MRPPKLRKIDMRPPKLCRAFLATVLLLAVQGVLSDTTPVTTAADIKDAIGALQNDQVIKIEAATIDLQDTLTIRRVSNVTIKGIERGTTLNCPSDGLIMRIQNAEDISLINLRFSGCQSNRSAVEIFGEYQESGKNQERSVSFERCSFSDNEKTGDVEAECTPGSVFKGGAAISGCNCSVSIRESTFTNNKAITAGAISFKNARLRVRETNFTSNSAEASGVGIVNTSDSKFRRSRFLRNSGRVQYIGVLDIRHGTTQFTDCIFDSNEAWKTGAVYFERANSSLRRCVFTNNTAQKNAGCIFANLGTVNINNCIFSGNRAKTTTGCILLFSITATIKNSVFDSNIAGKYNGALTIQNSTVTIQYSNLINNRAAKPGGALTAENSIVTIQYSNLINNRAAKSGGALEARFSTVTIQYSNLTNNRAAEKGGALQTVKSTVTIQHSNMINNGAGEKGGALQTEESTLNCTDSVFDDNMAVESGGSVHVSFTNLTITRCNFTRNDVEAANGGGVTAAGSNAIFDACIFEQNSCQQAFDVESRETLGQGGAMNLLKCPSRCVVKNSHFERNKARVGGALVIDQGADVVNCTFDNNTASSSGGALASTRGTTNITGTTFRRNWATKGGAVFVDGGDAFLMRAIFIQNNASNDGGALAAERSTVYAMRASFVDNKADWGGAVKLRTGSDFKVTGSSTLATFEHNIAGRGGAIHCHRCGEILAEDGGRLEFLRNQAEQRGGAIYFETGIALLNRDGFLKFQSNNAVSGGGIYFADAGEIEFNYHLWASGTVEFSQNNAVYGGAMFIISEHESVQSIFMSNCSFEDNIALGHEDYHRRYSRGEKDPYIDQNDSEAANSIINGSLGGKGGAFYIALKNTRNDSMLSQEYNHTTIRNNKADVGAGIFIANSYRPSVKFSRSKCPRPLRPTAPCQYIRFDAVRIDQNAANIAGGGMFVTGSTNFAYICAQSRDNIKNKLHRTIHINDPCLSFTNNTVKGKADDQNPHAGTDAYYLELQNVDGSTPLTDLNTGDYLRVVKNRAGRSPIVIEVKDQFAWTISRAIKDAELQVELVSDAIGGEKTLSAVKGVITIASTIVKGGNTTEEVTVRTLEDRNLSTTLKFETNPCPEGSWMNRTKGDCSRCPTYANYTFDEGENCLDCEENARCIGTTVLAPLDEYWHSTPFSPFFFKCTTETACKWPGREEALIQYYYNHSRVEQDIAIVDAAKSADLSFEGYQQCKTGYKGLMCGSCDANYGRAADGECVKCSYSQTVSALLSGLMTIVLFVILGTKLVLEIDAALSDVRAGLVEAAKRVGSPKEHEEESSSEQDTSSSANIRQRGMESNGGIQIELPEGPMYPPTSNLSPAIRENRVLGRAVQIVVDDDTFANVDARAISEKYIAASQGLSETYKLLFNYVQLNSIALSLEIDWGSGLRWLLRAQSSAVRIFSVAFFEPFECSMHDRGSDTNHSNLINGKWFSIVIPFISCGLFITLAHIYEPYAKMGKRFQRFDLFPSKRMIFLTLIFSSIVDIITELTTMIDCINPADSIDSSHSFSNYDTLPVDERLWVSDTAVVCWKGRHQVAAIFAVIGLFGCASLIIGSFFLLRYGKKSNKLRQRDFVKNYGVLYSSYRSDGVALYWGLIVVIRLSALAFIGVFTTYGFGPHTQISLMTGLLFISTANQQFVRPYDEPNSKDIFPSYAGSTLRYWGREQSAVRWVEFNQGIGLNTLESISLYMTLSIYISGLALSGNDGTSTNMIVGLVAGATVLNAGFVAFMLYRIYYASHNFFDVHARTSVKEEDGVVHSYEEYAKKLLVVKWYEYVHSTGLEAIYTVFNAKVLRRPIRFLTHRSERRRMQSERRQSTSATSLEIGSPK